MVDPKWRRDIAVHESIPFKMSIGEVADHEVVR